VIIVPGVKVFDESGQSYEILNQLGSGGFGVVFKIRHTVTGQEFALKTLPTEFGDEAIARSFKNEAASAIHINHRNVINYIFFHDGAKYDNLPLYIIMELANGGTLRDELLARRSDNSLYTIDEILGFYASLIAGMEAINEKIVHRDLKPENVLINDGIVKIADFGLAKIVQERTRTSTLKGHGSMEYYAPEAWNAEKNTMQMDVYALGIIFYEIATLRHPLSVNSPDAMAWQEAHRFQEPIPPSKHNSSISPEIDQTILRMLRKKPEERPQSWANVKKRLLKAQETPSDFEPYVEQMLQTLQNCGTLAFGRRLTQFPTNLQNSATYLDRQPTGLKGCYLVLVNKPPIVASHIVSTRDPSATFCSIEDSKPNH